MENMRVGRGRGTSVRRAVRALTWMLSVLLLMRLRTSGEDRRRCHSRGGDGNGRSGRGGGGSEGSSRN